MVRPLRSKPIEPPRRARSTPAAPRARKKRQSLAEPTGRLLPPSKPAGTAVSSAKLKATLDALDGATKKLEVWVAKGQPDARASTMRSLIDKTVARVQDSFTQKGLGALTQAQLQALSAAVDSFSATSEALIYGKDAKLKKAEVIRPEDRHPLDDAVLAAAHENVRGWCSTQTATKSSCGSPPTRSTAPAG